MNSGKGLGLARGAPRVWWERRVLAADLEVKREHLGGTGVPLQEAHHLIVVARDDRLCCGKVVVGQVCQERSELKSVLVREKMFSWRRISDTATVLRVYETLVCRRVGIHEGSTGTFMK